ncbi:MAG: hypothetical protein D6785_12445, partial [Planctomycetota bacterium]
MKRFYVLFGIFIWVLMISLGLLGFRHLPSKEGSKILGHSKKIIQYFREDYIPIRILLPQILFFEADFKPDFLPLTTGPQKVPAKLSRLFRGHNIALDPTATLEIFGEKDSWLLRDDAFLRHFVLRKKGKKLAVYWDVYLEKDDPVNFWDGKQYQVIGRIKTKLPHPEACMVVAEIFPPKSLLLNTNSQFIYSQDNGTFQEVVNTLLAGDSGEKIKKELYRIFSNKKERILEIFSPIVSQMVEASLPYLKEGITQSITEHQEELAKLVEKELLVKKLIPALQKELWPVVEEKAPPVITPVAEELWNQLPLAGIIGREMLYKIYLSKKSGRDRFNE